MKTTSLARFITLFLLFCYSFLACKKDQDTPPTDAEQEEFAAVSAESDATAEAIFNSVFDNVIGVNNEVGIGGLGIFSTSGVTDTVKCYSMTVTHMTAGSVFPIRVVLDFGRGCTGRDGRTRKGKMITDYSKRLTISGATATTRFEGYMVDDIEIQGEHIVANKSTNAQSVMEVKITAKLMTSSGDFSQWNSERNITQVEGQLTPLPVDDAFSVTGTASGFVKKGDKLFQWGANISDPLLKKFTCRWILDGVVTIKKNKTPIAIIDYGSGQCDNRAVFTVLGHVREISLR